MMPRLITFTVTGALLYLALNIWVVFIQWAKGACVPVGFC